MFSCNLQVLTTFCSCYWLLGLSICVWNALFMWDAFCSHYKSKWIKWIYVLVLFCAQVAKLINVALIYLAYLLQFKEMIPCVLHILDVPALIFSEGGTLNPSIKLKMSSGVHTAGVSVWASELNAGDAHLSPAECCCCLGGRYTAHQSIRLPLAQTPKRRSRTPRQRSPDTQTSQRTESASGAPWDRPHTPAWFDPSRLQLQQNLQFWFLPQMFVVLSVDFGASLQIIRQVVQVFLSKTKKENSIQHSLLFLVSVRAHTK